MAEKIKIRNVTKFSKLSDPGLSHLWAVEDEFDADEIRSVIGFAASEKCSILLPVKPTFHYNYWEGSRDGPKFATYNEGDLTSEERKWMISAEPGRFKGYLGIQGLDDLQKIYAWLIANGYRTQKKGIRVKKGYLNELSSRLEDLADHAISGRYACSCCVALGKVENDNRGGILSSDGKRLIFSPGRIPTLSGEAIQYWKITDLRLQGDQVKPSLEFFRGTQKSVIDRSDSRNLCILNLKEPKAIEVLQDFVSLQKGGEFIIDPLTLRIERDLLHDKYFREPDKFRVTWPNNRKELAEKFGTPSKKTKFETLQLGLLLGDRLEQVQKVVKALSGQKVVLRIGNIDSIEYFCLGEVLSSSVIEALILHLKIDYIVPGQKHLVFCEVQEKVTEETLALIWQMAEDYKLRDILFSGFQLTE